MAARNTALISVEEYLHSSYQPDCDYVDGVLEERNFGEWDHSRLQLVLARYLGIRERQWNVWVLLEQRIRVSPTRFRVPDVCVFARDREIEQIPSTPPLVCIEILSPEDRWSRVENRIKDFLTMGVERVWVFDPQDRQVFECTTTGRREVLDDLLEAPPVRIRVSELIAELD
jgi:Uma2 family endonuclease